jgi:hypothetical protein
MWTKRLVGILTMTVLAFETTGAKAGKPRVDLPVTTSLADYNAAAEPYSVQSDSAGPYRNGTGGVISILLANGYNGIAWGDWRVDLLTNPTSRTVGISFCDPTHGTVCPTNAVQPGDPGFTAPANPPWWGTAWQPARVIATCSAESRNMYAMKPADSFPCVGTIILPTINNVYYTLHMGYTNPFEPKPETQELQVTCNSSGTDGNCNAWSLDPVPVVNPDGTTSAGRTRAQLTRTVTNHGGNVVSRTNEGDFYLTFHILITRP